MGSRQKAIAPARPSVDIPDGAPFERTDPDGRIDPGLAACSAWTSVDTQIRHLIRQWAELEHRLARNHGWFGLTQEQRQSLPEAHGLHSLDLAIEALSARRDALLSPLTRTRAVTLEGIAAKLDVALRLVEDHEVTALLAGAARDLSACARRWKFELK